MNTIFLLFARYNSHRLNVAQIADYMSVSESRVRNLITSGELPFATYKEGHQHYADLNDVAKAHDARMEAARVARAAELEAMS